MASNTAAYNGGSSLLGAWLNTAFLPAGQATATSSAAADDAAAGAARGGARPSTSKSMAKVVLQGRDELDKLSKGLRRREAQGVGLVSLEFEYEVVDGS